MLFGLLFLNLGFNFQLGVIGVYDFLYGADIGICVKKSINRKILENWQITVLLARRHF